MMSAIVPSGIRLGFRAGSVLFGFRVIDQVLAYTWQFVDDGDGEIFQLLGRTNSGEEKETASVDCSGADNCFGAGIDGVLGTRLESDIYTSDSLARHIDLADPGIGEDCKIWSLLLATENWVDVCD